MPSSDQPWVIFLPYSYMVQGVETRPIPVRSCEARVRDCRVKQLDIFCLLVIILFYIYFYLYSIFFVFFISLHFYFTLFYFILFSNHLPFKLFNISFVVFLYNELRHMHKQEIEFWTCVCTSFHYCQLFTDH